MKWIRFTLDTHTDAVDMLSYMLDEIGVEGIEIEDHLPLSEEDKKKMFVDILPDPEDNDGTAKVHFYMEPENCDPEKVMIQVQNIFQEIKPFCEIGKGTISLSETEDKDWINNWKTFFKPFRAADDIVIKPTWEEYKKEKPEVTNERPSLYSGSAYRTDVSYARPRIDTTTPEYFIKLASSADTNTVEGQTLIIGVKGLENLLKAEAKYENSIKDLNDDIVGLTDKIKSETVVRKKIEEYVNRFGGVNYDVDKSITCLLYTSDAADEL